jgi:hypothetical protein
MMDDDVRAALQEINQRLDHIEQFVWRVGKKNGPQYTPTAGFLPAPSDVIDLARAGKTDAAIARYVELTGTSAGRAAAVVDGL